MTMVAKKQRGAPIDNTNWKNRVKKPVTKISLAVSWPGEEVAQIAQHLGIAPDKLQAGDIRQLVYRLVAEQVKIVEVVSAGRKRQSVTSSEGDAALSTPN